MHGPCERRTLFRRSLLAFLPNTKSMASITFDLPEPLGPTTEEKHLWKGPISRTPAYDLKFSSTILVIMSRCGFVAGAPPGAAGGSAGMVVICREFPLYAVPLPNCLGQ